jgi:hypothetical protein
MRSNQGESSDEIDKLIRTDNNCGNRAELERLKKALGAI